MTMFDDPTNENFASSESVGRLYRLLTEPTPGDTTSKIILRNCLYEGVIYRYGTVKFGEVNGSLRISFVYEIVDDAGITIDDPKHFETLLGDVLVDIIKNYELVRGDKLEQNRKTNPNQSGS